MTKGRLNLGSLLAWSWGCTKDLHTWCNARQLSRACFPWFDLLALAIFWMHPKIVLMLGQIMAIFMMYYFKCCGFWATSVTLSLQHKHTSQGHGHVCQMTKFVLLFVTASSDRWIVDPRGYLVRCLLQPVVTTITADLIPSFPSTKTASW
jgi:hypothetical protein